MTLHLIAKEVAQANIDQFDRLGAFHGVTDCRYHYPDLPGKPGNLGCAIGIMDVWNELLNKDDCSLDALSEVVVDDWNRAIFIQKLHDFKVRGKPGWFGNSRIPPEVDHIVAGLNSPDDLTPEIYKEIMRLLAA